MHRYFVFSELLCSLSPESKNFLASVRVVQYVRAISKINTVFWHEKRQTHQKHARVVCGQCGMRNHQSNRTNQDASDRGAMVKRPNLYSAPTSLLLLIDQILLVDTVGSKASNTVWYEAVKNYCPCWTRLGASCACNSLRCRSKTPAVRLGQFVLAAAAAIVVDDASCACGSSACISTDSC